MLVNLLFLCLLASGSVYCSVKFNKKFEEVLPITCMGIGMMLFLFGLAGFMKTGTFFVIAIAVLLYIFTLIEFLKDKKRISIFVRNFFTPGFVFFVLVAIVLSFALYNQLTSKWDEFSHWVDIVKVMTTLDDFGTNAQSFSAFKSYPPAMPLFQYMLQKIYLLINPEQVFNEWRVYWAYQVYFISVMLPAFRNVQWKNFVGFLSLGAVILFVPLIFFSDIYWSSYIDPFLAILAGAGFSIVMLYDREDKGIIYSIYIWIVIATLVLTKDAGIIFAIFLAILYMIDYCLNNEVIRMKIINKTMIIHLILSLVSIILPKMLWKWKLFVTQAAISFETHIDWKVLLNVFLGRDNSYRSEVLKKYSYAVFDEYIKIGHTDLRITYFMLFVLMSVSLYLVLRFLYRKGNIDKKQAMVYGCISVLQLVVFIVGMCVIYMFNFSEYEALELASFSRYLNIAFLATGLMIFILLWKINIFIPDNNRRLYGVLFTSLILFIAPTKEAVKVLNGMNREEAYGIREEYHTLTEKIMTACDGDDSIFVVAQEDTGFDRWVIRFNVRPNRVEGNWSIGVPFYEGDIWTVTKTAEEWREELIKGYDYVALYHLNDYFYENYSVLFDDSNTIMENGLYKVNKQQGTLSFIN